MESRAACRREMFSVKRVGFGSGVRFVLFQYYCWLFKVRQMCVGDDIFVLQSSSQRCKRDCAGMLLTGHGRHLLGGRVWAEFDHPDVATCHRPLVDVRACARLVGVTTTTPSCVCRDADIPRALASLNAPTCSFR